MDYTRPRRILQGSRPQVCCPHPCIPQGRGSVRGKPLRVSPLAFSHPPAGEHFCESKSVAPRNKRHALACLLFLVTAHRFCCLHSRPPQGRGSVRGEPLTGSPTRVQSPARRRSLLRSKSAAPKKKDTHVGVFLFCDHPPLLLSVNQCLLGVSHIGQTLFAIRSSHFQLYDLFVPRSTNALVLE